MSDVRRVQNLSAVEQESQSSLTSLLSDSPLPSGEKIANLGLYLKRQDLMRVLMLDRLYKKLVKVPGDLYEFGCRWGQNLSLLTSLRGIYEPYNFTRRIFGFDTFSGFAGVGDQDGEHAIMEEGAYGVTQDYEQHLYQVLDAQERQSPLSHIQRFQLIKGDVRETLDVHLKQHPESIIALAYLDFDLFEPTAYVLEKIKDRLVKGSVIAFDEVNHSVYPGETAAIRQVLGLNNLRMIREPHCSSQAFYIYE